MWYNNSEYFKGKFSSGTSPLLKKKQFQHKKKSNNCSKASEKFQKKTKIIKKSGFSKFKLDLVEFDDAKSMIQGNDSPKGSLKTPSPRATKKNFDFHTVSLKKSRNSKYYDDEYDSTAETYDFTEEDFIKTNFNNMKSVMKTSPIKSQKSFSSKNSRFESDYEILEVIGKGNFGTVYKCVNKIDGSIYAIKCTNINMKCKNMLLFSTIF